MKSKLFIMASMIFTMQNTSAAAAANGAGAVDEPRVVRVGGEVVRVGGELGRFNIDEARASGFSASLRTYMGVSANSTDATDADGYGKCEGPCGKYNGTVLTFKATTDRDDAKVLWYMLVRFMPLARSYGSMDVLESKVEAKIFFSPDTYEAVYGVGFKPRAFASEGGIPYFNLNEDISTTKVAITNHRKIFEWPIDAHFAGDRGLQSRDRAFGHTTPQDIINGINTLRTLGAGLDRHFPLYKLGGVDYYKDVANCVVLCIRALHAFGIPMDLPIERGLSRDDPLSLYLNHDYAAAYGSCISFAFTGPQYATPDRFINKIIEMFFEEGRNALGGRKGHREIIKNLFPLAYQY